MNYQVTGFDLVCFRQQIQSTRRHCPHCSVCHSETENPDCFEYQSCSMVAAIHHLIAFLPEVLENKLPSLQC